MLYVKESKKVQDSGFHAVDSRFQVLDAGFFVGVTLIRNSNHKSDPDSVSCEAQDSGYFQKKKFPDSGYHKALISENIPDSAIQNPLHGAKEFTHVLTFLYRELKFNKMKIQGGSKITMELIQ